MFFVKHKTYIFNDNLYLAVIHLCPHHSFHVLLVHGGRDTETISHTQYFCFSIWISHFHRTIQDHWPRVQLVPKNKEQKITSWSWSCKCWNGPYKWFRSFILKREKYPKYSWPLAKFTEQELKLSYRPTGFQMPAWGARHSTLLMTGYSSLKCHKGKNFLCSPKHM